MDEKGRIDAMRDAPGAFACLALIVLVLAVGAALQVSDGLARAGIVRK